MCQNVKYAFVLSGGMSFVIIVRVVLLCFVENVAPSDILDPLAPSQATASADPADKNKLLDKNNLKISNVPVYVSNSLIIISK